MTRQVRVGSGDGQVTFANDAPLALVAGPCVIESEQHALWIAQRIRELVGAYVFKASFDKANRSSVTSYRGPGLEEGLRILSKVRQMGIPVLTDIHEPSQAEVAAEHVDILQIPAFLCRQTDLLLAAGRTCCAVNIKKGQFVSPWDMKHIVEKCRSAGNDRIFVTERGASFGYNNLVVDMRSLAIMRKFAPVVFDATHSVQLPSASGDGDHAVSGGQPEFIPLLSRAAVAAGVDGVFMEVHDNPKEAKSDGANALESTKLRGVLKELQAIQSSLVVAHAKP